LEQGATEYLHRIGAALEQISAFHAEASNEDDKYAIWHRVADPSIRKLPLEKARKNKLFQKSIFKRFDMVMRSQIAAPLFRASLVDGDYTAALHYIGLGAAFGASDLEALDSMHTGELNLSSTEVKVNSYGQLVDWPLLHCAAYFGHAGAIDWLLQHHADIEAKTSFGLAALHQAARNGNAEITELLLFRGARIDAETCEGRMALHLASHQGHANAVEVLLCYGAEGIDVRVKGRSPVHDAAACGHHEVLQLLLDQRADPTVPSGEGFTALHMAARDNHIEVASSILQAAGKSRKLLRMKSRCGTTALDLAEKEGNLEVADIIRDAQAP